MRPRSGAAPHMMACGKKVPYSLEHLRGMVLDATYVRMVYTAIEDK